MNFTETEKTILRHLQGDLPHSLTPFADMARQCGCAEKDALELIERLKANGVIRRFGASMAHNKAGWRFNALVAWKASEEEAKSCEALVKSNNRISHAYFRPSPSQDWPYTFYTMIHGQSEQECLDVIAELAAVWPFEHEVLRSIRELKKTSPVYF